MSIILDDRDLSFTYEGPWYFGGAQSEYDVTTTGTSTIGSMVLFKFTGVSVSVFGTIGPSDVGAPVSSYQVDDLPAVIFTAPAQGGTLYHYNFFASTPLANGPHQLKITNLNSSSLWLDYVQYTPSSATSSSSSSPATTDSQQPISTSPPTIPEPPTDPSSSPSTSTSSSSWTLAISSSSSSSSSSLDSWQSTATLPSTTPGAQTNTSSSSSSSPVPQISGQTTKKDNVPIVGGVVGGGVLVVVVLALIFYLRRRRSAQAVVGETNVDNARLNQTEASVSEVRSNHNFSIASSASLVGLDDWPHSSRPQSSVSPSSIIGVRSVRDVADLDDDDFLPHQIADEERVYLHEDGGIRIAGSSLRGQVDIPPEYREYL